MFFNMFLKTFQLSVWQCVYLPWLYSLTVNYVLLLELPYHTSLLSLHSFFSKTYEPPGKYVSGSEMCCEWSHQQTLDRPPQLPPPPHRYSAHTLWNIFFDCDFFPPPPVPFLCLTCLPCLSLYGWLNNFTRPLMPKGTQYRETKLLVALPISSLGPPKRLSILTWLRWFSYSNRAATVLPRTLMDTLKWMEHLYELVMFYCLAQSSHSVFQSVPLPYS